VISDYTVTWGLELNVHVVREAVV